MHGRIDVANNGQWEITASNLCARRRSFSCRTHVVESFVADHGQCSEGHCQDQQIRKDESKFCVGGVDTDDSIGCSMYLYVRFAHFPRLTKRYHIRNTYDGQHSLQRGEAIPTHGTYNATWQILSNRPYRDTDRLLGPWHKTFSTRKASLHAAAYTCAALYLQLPSLASLVF